MVLRRPFLSLSSLALALLCATPAAADPSELPAQFGWNYGETDTPRMGGMAGALLALGSDTNAHYLNPANLGLARLYHIQALTQFTPEAGRHLYGGAIVDSTRRLSGGVSFIGGFQDAEGIDRSHLDLRVTLAFAISPAFLLGLSGRYLSLDQEGFGPLGQSRVSGGLLDADDLPDGREALVNDLTFDAGITIVATDELHIGIAGHNLTYPNNGLLPTTLGGGIGYKTGDFSVEVDGVADFSSWAEISPRINAGGEYLIADHFPARVGYRFDLLNGSELDPSHQLSVGFGYIDTAFAVEASVRRTLVGPSATMIMAGVTVHLESFGVPIQEF